MSSLNDSPNESSHFDASQLNLDDHSQHGDRTVDEEPHYNEVDVDGQEDALNYFLIGIELFNFKSYQGLNIIGPFTTLTAIIGPNGSGKSNLMDAISFALCIHLGSKKLRTNKIANLVNENSESSLDSSSSTAPSIDPHWKAYVKLYFKDRSGEIITNIQRIILKDGNSRFMINGEQLANKEPYLRYLTKLGLNAKTKIFLFFQGMVDTLVTKNPKEFTRYLEEISGSVQFERDYNSFKNELSVKENRLQVLQNEKIDLSKTKQFLSYLVKQRDKNTNLCEEIEQMKIQIILFELYINFNAIEQTNENLTIQNAAFQDIELQISELQVNKNRLDENLKVIAKKQGAIKVAYRESELNLVCKNKQKCNSIDSRIIICKKRMAAGKLKEENVRKQIRDDAGKVENLQVLIDEKFAEIEAIKRRLDSASLNISQNKLNEFHRLKGLFQSRVISEEEEFVANEKELAMLKQEVTLIKDKKDTIKKEIESLTHNMEVTDKMKNKLDEEIKSTTKELNDSKKTRDVNQKKLDKLSAKLVELQKKLEDSQELLSNKYKTMSRNEKNEQSRQFVEHLKRMYPGRVYGRFHQLIKPINSKYNLAFSRVGKQHNSAIVVDSYVTLNEIHKKEGRSSSQEVFLPIDSVKAPELKEFLRNIQSVNGEPVNDVRLVYDLVKLKSDFEKYSNLEKAIRFVFRNTLVCPDQATASNVAYNLGDGQMYDAISLDGSYFQKNGRISANFSASETTHNAWNQSDYLEEKEKCSNLQQEYSEQKDIKMKAESEFENSNRQILRINARFNIATKHRDELLKKESENKIAISKLQEQMSNLDDESVPLKRKLQEKNYIRQANRERIVQIETEVFADFLADLSDYDTIKEFEVRFYNEQDSDMNKLDKLQEELEKLQNEQNELKNKNLDESLARWRKLIEECVSQLEELDIEKQQSETEFQEANQKFENCLENSDQIHQQIKKAHAECDKVNTDLNKLQAKLQTLKQSSVSLASSLKTLHKVRHDIFKKTYIEAIRLPVEDRNAFSQLCANEMSNVDQMYERESEVKINFDRIQDLIPDDPQNEQEFRRIIIELEKKLQQKEEDLKKLTVSADERLDEKINENNQKIRQNGRKITQGREELLKVNADYERVKNSRLRMFNSFFDKISSNLDAYYKALTHNASSQAFLMPENAEEPYLAGIQYSCIVPGKVFQPISCLSGGEKSLAAFAFVFSCYSERLPSFFILDEIDGPLDNDNIAKLIRFIKSKLTETQFIFISHKHELFGRTNSLIGVCREVIGQDHNAFKSKTVSLDLTRFPETA